MLIAFVIVVVLVGIIGGVSYVTLLYADGVFQTMGAFILGFLSYAIVVSGVLGLVYELARSL